MADHESDLGPDAPPTEEEQREARALMEALAGTSEHGDAAFLRAVALAEAPAELDSAVHDRLVAQALTHAAPPRASGRVIRVLFGGTSALALAAGLIFAITSADRGPPGPLAARLAAPLAQSRSTQELFHEPFRGSEASARIDRIALARAGDLRENRFSRWGVR